MYEQWNLQVKQVKYELFFFLQENVFENDVSNPKWQMFF